MLLSGPVRNTRFQPPIELGKFPPYSSGVAVIIPPADYDGVEAVDQIGEGLACRRFLHLDLDLVAQLFQLALRNEELADPVAGMVGRLLHHLIAEDVVRRSG